ncbi:hypothetical protein C7212DRAFT_347250 [Tuber magnatum]|uniref:RING-type domain-containing protein n=1 Tax=Tuber magnatum TaxID=42249 RepID=A0A317SF62_9PEZI|nr:hypothetical protein C7212DRAFT_347250 [Tuber magnatum]
MAGLGNILAGHPTPSPERALNDGDGDLAEALESFLREQQEQELEEPLRSHREQPQPEKSLKKKKPLTSQEDVLQNVLSIFPDACPIYILKLYGECYLLQDSDIAEFIANKLAETDYPKSESVLKAGMKRKRAEQDKKRENGPDYEGNDRPPVDWERSELVRSILKQEFPLMPVWFIEKAMAQNRNYLAKSYSALVKAGKSYDPQTNTPYKQLLHPRKMEGRTQELKKGKVWAEISAELEYARSKVRREEMQAQIDAQTMPAARIDEKEHQESNMLMECGCCFDEYPFISMTHCNDLHFFCLDCARRNAETEVGRGHHKLSCIDGSGCKAPFPRGQMLRFLDAGTLSALEKIEQEDALRIADIDGLVKCPFCDYGAICVPPQVDKEFKCQNPDCMEISCRLCNQKSHIPLTCQEYAKDNKLNARHRVEEAMTEALVRKCNKCSYPYIKEYGCNKIYCSRCYTLQCYICSQTIGAYGHFKGQEIGGKIGNCPLYDNTEEWHRNEVETAAKEAMGLLRVERPELNDEDLKIKLSERVRKEEEAKRCVTPAVYGGIPPYQVLAALQPVAAPPGMGRRAAGPPPPAELPAQPVRGPATGAGPRGCLLQMPRARPARPVQPAHVMGVHQLPLFHQAAQNMYPIPIPQSAPYPAPNQYPGARPAQQPLIGGPPPRQGAPVMNEHIPPPPPSPQQRYRHAELSQRSTVAAARPIGAAIQEMGMPMQEQNQMMATGRPQAQAQAPPAAPPSGIPARRRRR